MEQTKDLLQEIFENAKLCKDVLSRLISHSQDANLRSAMAEQFAEYHNIIDEVEKALSSCNSAPNEKHGASRRAFVLCASSASAKKDSSPEHMAEMLVQGSIMGVIDITRKLKEFAGADESAKETGRRLLRTEENNIKQMLHFV